MKLAKTVPAALLPALVAAGAPLTRAFDLPLPAPAPAIGVALVLLALRVGVMAAPFGREPGTAGALER